MKPLRRWLCWTSIAAVLASAAPAACAQGDPEKASEFYEDGVKRFSKQDYDGAIIQLKNALQQDPYMLPAMALLGEAYLETGNGGAAESALNEATQNGADPALTAVPLARAFVLQFKHDQLLSQSIPPRLPLTKRAELLEVKAQAALQVNNEKLLNEILREIEKLDPDSVAALTIKATIAMREGDLTTTEGYVSRALAVAPDSPSAWLTSASLYHVQGKNEEALRDYAKVIELDSRNIDARLARIGLLLDANRDTETAEDFEYIGARSTADPRLAYLRAIKLARAGDQHGARTALSEAANVIDALGRLIVTRNLQLLLVGGIVNYSLGNLEAARGYLEEYVHYAGAEIQTRTMLATILLRQGEFRRAADLLEEIVKGGAETPELLAMLARAYTGNGEHHRATVMLERAAALRPGDPTLATRLALSRANRGETKTALVDLAEIFAKDEYQKVAGMPLAIMYLNREAYAEAADVARRLHESEPDNLTYINLFGIAQVGLGNLQEARLLFERALSLDPEFTPALMNIGKIDRRQGDFAAAEKRFTELLGAKPGDAQLMLELARTANAKGDKDTALRWAKDAMTAAPASFEIASYLIDLHLAAGDTDSAVAIAWDQEKHHPENLYVLEAQINVLAAKQDPAAARPILKHMADVAQFNTDWLLKVSAYQTGFGFLSDAEYTLFKAVQGRPNDLLPRARLAQVELGLGKLDAALERAQQLIKDSPEHAAGYLLSAEVQSARKEYTAAAENFAEALRRSATPEIALRYHLALRNAADPNAETVLLDWLKDHPKDLWAKGALAEHAMQTGRYDAARERFLEFLKGAPEHAPAINNLANVMLKLDRTDQALVYARRAYELTPDNPLVNDTLGWILINTGQVEEGMRFLREARTRASTVPEIRYHLAVALNKQGRLDEALTELTQALNSARDFDGKDDAIRLRAELGG
jgi:putative PEP-CTERM system TPR-repeat lipoprotein